MGSPKAKSPTEMYEGIPEPVEKIPSATLEKGGEPLPKEPRISEELEDGEPEPPEERVRRIRKNLDGRRLGRL